MDTDTRMAHAIAPKVKNKRKPNLGVARILSDVLWHFDIIILSLLPNTKLGLVGFRAIGRGDGIKENSSMLN